MLDAQKRYMEVNLSAIKRNYDKIRREVKVPVMAVVKGDAYGHGLEEVALTLQQAGAEWFGVEFLKEAIELRRAGVRGRILCFTAPICREDCEKFMEYDITPTVYNLDSAELLNKAAFEKGTLCRVHLKFDTGMGRFGFGLENLDEILVKLKNYTNLVYEGAYTHFSDAFARKSDYTLRQLSCFEKVIGNLKKAGINVTLRHAASSVAAMDFPKARMDMVRVGGALFGVTMFKNKSVELEKASCVKVRIFEIRHLVRGSYIGYGRTYRASKDMLVGIIPVGYYEGLKVQRRNYTYSVSGLIRNIYHDVKDFLRPQPVVFINGRPLKVLGRIGMQLTAVDLTGVKAKVGDEVTVNIDPIYYKGAEKIYLVEEEGKSVGRLGENGFLA
ncbi:Alanine racemase [Fervidicola ferrireducens]|uniref:Alanine racemase n=1 Tax=Fervidicola ferrireducens TaxID=520764 RepID=A0A140LDD9_9FIRM|nr:alanine racemase [Fervidicola ferrireducens]KXG78564.1 Alanine racemase [Fervidicola ferrireducens]